MSAPHNGIEYQKGEILNQEIGGDHLKALATRLMRWSLDRGLDPERHTLVEVARMLGIRFVELGRPNDDCR